VSPTATATTLETLHHRAGETLHQHAGEVASTCERTARHMGMPAAKARRVALAGELHDIGKVGVPPRVLRKPDTLDPHEWGIVREHPEVGERLLRAAGVPDVASWVGAHHERFDGTGYPRGLRGEEIPIEARIVAVADAFDAMISDRPYRPALSLGTAVAELRAAAGTQFDPDVVDAFLDSLALA
jgi:HD-GYP domain-containing protein (c-di-GMP phosphodiesterase class II)